MAITTHGLETDPSIRALEEGEGFVVTFVGKWFDNIPNHELSQEQQQAINEAKQQGLLGLQIEKHRDTFADASTLQKTATDNWVSAMQTFINNFNTENA